MSVHACCARLQDCSVFLEISLDSLIMQGTQLAYSGLLSNSEPDATVPGLRQLPHKMLFDFTTGQTEAPALVEPWLPRVRSLLRLASTIVASSVNRATDRIMHLSNRAPWQIQP